jgi:hypothetical protein
MFRRRLRYIHCLNVFLFFDFCSRSTTLIILFLSFAFSPDHNIRIYYPTSTFCCQIVTPTVCFRLTHQNYQHPFPGAGGGCKHLFRKIGNRSSEFHPDENEVRRNGSYIYEEFLETQGTDVKMYTYVKFNGWCVFVYLVVVVSHILVVRFCRLITD